MQFIRVSLSREERFGVRVIRGQIKTLCPLRKTLCPLRLKKTRQRDGKTEGLRD